ncbi:MAG TPA: CRTAC1 family protein [Abditibacteriaceae bacterium]|jgi:hypothetical protein
MKAGLLIVLVVLAVLTEGCAFKPQDAIPPETRRAAPLSIPVHFNDITARAGLHFNHNNGAYGGMLLPETMGSGVAFIDYNGDGYQDIFLVNSRDWTVNEVKAFRNRPWTSSEREIAGSRKGAEAMTAVGRHAPRPRQGQRSIAALYRNNKNGTFSDMTRGSGLEVEMYGMGVAVGDYDHDGRPDLYVTALKRNYLFRNVGNGRFHEVAEQAGVLDSGWSTSAAWVDYDRDGSLDLFVCHYLDWTPASDVFQVMGNRTKLYSSPNAYAGKRSRLFRNLGQGRFADVSIEAGIQPKARSTTEAKRPGSNGLGMSGDSLVSRGLGVALCDFNNDNWPDIIVANDMFFNHLFKNNRNGTFSEIASIAGISRSSFGQVRSGMGIDVADIDHSGHESVVIGNYSGQMLGLYHDEGNGQFTDIALRSQVGRVSNNYLSFGCAFMDVDNDSWPDILVANGHVDKTLGSQNPRVGYAQRLLLFHNEGRSNFREIAEQSGVALKKKIVGRGLAYSDIDLDGDLDAIVTVNGGAPLLLQNNGGNGNNSLRLVLQGTRSNKSAIGTQVVARVGTDTLHRMIRSGSSYLSQSELPITLGLGKANKIDEITLRWPSGKVTKLQDVTAGQVVEVDEDKGVISKQAFATG